MAVDIGGVGSSERKRMRKTLDNSPKLIVGDKVEVRSIEMGYEGSWHHGTVIACEDQSRRVQYDHRLCIDGSNKLIKSIKVPRIVDGIISASKTHRSHRGLIRPLPPPLYFEEGSLHYGQCVDAYHDKAWWEGVVFDYEDGCENRLIFFPDKGDEMQFRSDKLRVTQVWDEFLGEWKPRGNWYFLELIEEFKEEWLLQVSVRQIWDELQGKEGFRKLKKWNSMGYGIWRNLVWETISDNCKLILKHFFREPNLLGDFTHNSQLSSSETSVDVIMMPKYHFGSSLLQGCCSLRSPHGKFRRVNQRKRHLWLPAGHDIIPGPEFCPDSVTEFNLMCSSKKKAPHQLMLNVRKHLVYLGWKIEFMRDRGVLRILYTSPEGKSYTSLPKACKNLNSEFSNPSLDMKIEGFSCNDSKSPPTKVRLYKKRNHMWVPAGHHLVPGAEFCPDAIRDYNLISKTRKRPPSHLILNVRKHLSFLGWKIEFMRYNGAPKMRYTSPSGTFYESLPKACNHLIESTDTFSVPHKNNMNISADMLDRLSPSPLAVEPQASTEDAVIVFPDDIVVEPEYCPEAIKQYYLLGSVKRIDYYKCFEDPISKEVKLKAKKHLSALGWSFWYAITERGQRVLRYTSRTGRSYNTLRAACKGCIDEGVVHDSNSFTTKGDQNMTVDEETKAQLAGERLPSKSTEVEANDNKLSQYALPVGTSISRKLAEVGKTKVGEVSKVGRKRMNSNLFIDSHLLQKKCKRVGSNKLNQRKKTRLWNMGGDFSRPVLRSSKRAQQVVVSSSPYQDSQTTLSRLIDNDVVLPSQKVHYFNKEDNRAIGEGLITRVGIECICCQKIFTLKKFELHAGSNNHSPAANIFLEDGRSLLDCQLQLKCRDNKKNLTVEPHVRKDRWDHDKNDYICSVCCYGGVLILCDQCPSAFHTNCLGLKSVPDGDWFCPPCCCGICGDSRFSEETREFTDNGFLSCDQCGRRYHIGCSRKRAVLKVKNNPKESWFCNEKCEQIFLGLHKLLGKSVPVGGEDITWTLLKHMDGSDGDHSVPDMEALTEKYSKLNIALSVMHECFEPSKERKTRRDVLEDVIFSRWSELNRLNFQGFYTVLLERNVEVITVATVRVHGEKVAEVPLVGTRFQYRGLGMCRMLMNELEKKLMELGVERLVLPAVPSMLNTWTKSFGFTKMTSSERLNFLDYTFLDFEGTAMCQKLLREIPSTCSSQIGPEQTMMMFSENKYSDGNSAISELFQADPVVKVKTADQGSAEQTN